MIIEKIKKALIPEVGGVTPPPKPGLRQYEKEIEGRQVKYHMRVDRDGAGLLIANAAAACRLSATGVVLAEGILENTPEDRIIRRISKTFSGTDKTTVEKDLERVKQTITDMAFPGGRFPLMTLDDPNMSVRDRALSAPFAAEMGIDGTGDPSARIDKLWEVAIPQVVLIHLPGAPAERLIEAVERAEDHGLIAGVRAPATDLLADKLLDRLAQAGLDHVDVYLAGADPDFHDTLFGSGDHDRAKEVFERCRELELCPVAVIPIVKGSMERLEATIRSLPDMHVHAATVFALAEAEGTEDAGGVKSGELRQTSVIAQEICDDLHINLVFAPPVERDPNEPLRPQVRRGPRAAGEASIRITPNGSVIPPHGPRIPLGNILTQPFDEIWSDASFTHLRESVGAVDSCEDCPGISACASGCIVNPRSWARLETAKEN